jgi:hypothetical protein
MTGEHRSPSPSPGGPHSSCVHQMHFVSFHSIALHCVALHPISCERQKKRRKWTLSLSFSPVQSSRVVDPFSRMNCQSSLLQKNCRVFPVFESSRTAVECPPISLSLLVFSLIFFSRASKKGPWMIDQRINESQLELISHQPNECKS